MLQFEKPIYKITDSIESNFYGRFELEPLERGFGTTIGNALRRVMLSSLPGSAISSIKIDGVLHEFQTIDGVYDKIKSTRKAILISGLNVGGTEYHDTFVELTVSGTNYTGTIYGKTITISNADLVTVSASK